MNVDPNLRALSTDNAAPFRRIMLSGLAAGESASEAAISLLDDTGNTLQRAPVNEDGSCDLSEDALTAAQLVLFQHNVSVPAEKFRGLLETTDTIDLAALRTQPAPALVNGQPVPMPHRPWISQGRDDIRD
jgi:hypothetical protein